MPVRNEGVNIEIMLKFLRAVIEIDHEIIIIYDDLNDDSIPVVKRLQSQYPNLRLLHNNLARGVTNAIKAGINACFGEYVLIFAVDEVGPVLAIDDMIRLMDEGCDFVSCTRYAKGGRRLGGSWIGGILSRLANKFFNILSGSVLTDCTTGVKMLRKRIFEKIHLEANPVGWVVVFELAIKVQMAGFKVDEVPIVSIDRLYGGKSTFLLGFWCKEYLKWFVWGIMNLPKFHKKQRVAVSVPTKVS